VTSESPPGTHSPSAPDKAVPVSARYQGADGVHYASTVQRYRAAEGLLNREKYRRYTRRDATVLDFGCASGSTLAALDAARRIGIEVNPITRAEAARAGIEVHESLLTVPDASVDLAITNHALEHVLAPFDALVGLRRVLRADGRLVVCVPADDWRNARRWAPGDPNHHLFAWTPLTLGNLLEEAGFLPESVTMRHRAWPRYYLRLHRMLPRPLWEGLCLLWAYVFRRREIIAVAVPAPRPTADSSPSLRSE
jgi:SAM-dependent methyltransferase